jgi:hypothetical protein
LPRRTAIFKQGYVPQLPNLSKQETVSFAAWARIMFNCYAANGDGETVSFTNVLPMLKDAHLAMMDGQEDVKQPMMAVLVRECERVLDKFASLAVDAKKHARDVNQWSPVVSMIYTELVRILDVAESAKSDFASMVDVRKELVRFFKLAIKILVVDSQEVRGSLQRFLDVVAEKYLNL